MRIIAGEFRGRKLAPPDEAVTRPITDRAKQSLFDVLSPRIEGATVYDLFAGSGSMGLECLSRGASRAYFFEADRTALAGLRKNITAFGVGMRCELRAGDLFKAFNARAAKSPAADLIFLDPPYRFLRERPADLQQLAQRLAAEHLAPGGVVIFRHESTDALTLPPLERFDLRTYGQMAIELLSQPAGATP
jgi:16S rRNA (guanine(966)-N(2))-methyltransferase RsmD